MEPLQEEAPTDLDQEEVEWRTWLGELMRDFPSPAEGADEEDGDYNFLADQQQEAEEVEEFRNDRAVRIPGERGGGVPSGEGWVCLMMDRLCLCLQMRRCQTSLRSSLAV